MVHCISLVNLNSKNHNQTSRFHINRWFVIDWIIYCLYTRQVLHKFDSCCFLLIKKWLKGLYCLFFFNVWRGAYVSSLIKIFTCVYLYIHAFKDTTLFKFQNKFSLSLTSLSHNLEDLLQGFRFYLFILKN